MSDTIHATTVAIGGRGVLIEGPSGAGKSDLALRLIDRGALLVADDRTILAIEDGVLVARCPATIAGLIEVRGLGLLRLPHLAAAPVALALLCTDSVARMPDAAVRTLAGRSIPQVALDPREASAAIKAELALAHFGSRP